MSKGISFGTIAYFANKHMENGFVKKRKLIKIIKYNYAQKKTKNLP